MEETSINIPNSDTTSNGISIPEMLLLRLARLIWYKSLPIMNRYGQSIDVIQ